MLVPNQQPRANAKTRLSAMWDRALRDPVYADRMDAMYGPSWMVWLRHPINFWNVARSPMMRDVMRRQGRAISEYLARSLDGQTDAYVGLARAIAISPTALEALWPRVAGAGILRRCPNCGAIYAVTEAHVCRVFEAYDDEDEEYEYERTVYQYHQHPRRNDGYFDAPTASEDPAFGMELEFYCDAEGEHIAASLPDYILETDASLHSEYGVELVLPPWTLKQHKEKLPGVVQTLKRLGAKAYRAPGGRYGVHISVHRNNLSPLQEARMALFLTMRANASFARAVAQRHRVFSGDVDFGQFLPTANLIRHALRGVCWRDWESNKKKVRGFGKYSPLHFKDELLECRIFQSTLHEPSLLKHVEFYAALVHWTRPSSCTGTSYHHQDFYDWVIQHAALYPHLAMYLQRPTYVVRYGRGEIVNTWR